MKYEIIIYCSNNLEMSFSFIKCHCVFELTPCCPGKLFELLPWGEGETSRLFRRALVWVCWIHFWEFGLECRLACRCCWWLWPTVGIVDRLYMSFGIQRASLACLRRGNIARPRFFFRCIKSSWRSCRVLSSMTQCSWSDWISLEAGCYTKNGLLMLSWRLMVEKGGCSYAGWSNGDE